MFCVKCGREASRPQQISGGRTPAALCHGCDKSAGYCRCTPMTTADEHDTAAQVAEDASTGRTSASSATDLLAEALASGVYESCFIDDDLDTAAVILAASPRLAAALELGLAWQDAVDALPEGWRGPTTDIGYDDYSAEAWPPVDADFGEQDPIEGRAPTPTEALRALAARLREVAK